MHDVNKSFSFASVATATQIILATLPLYSQNATWRSSTANTVYRNHPVRPSMYLVSATPPKWLIGFL